MRVFSSIPTDERVIIDPDKTSATGRRVLTYGERIALGGVLESVKAMDAYDPKTHLAIFDGFIDILHKGQSDLEDIEATISKENLQYIEELLFGIMGCIEKEKILLTWRPGAKEKAAGIEGLFKDCGEFMVLKTLGKMFGKSIDEVQRWPYTTVLTIQFTDMQEAKYKKNWELLNKPKSKKSWQR